MKKIEQVLMIDEEDSFIPRAYGIVFYQDGSKAYMNYENLMSTLHKYTKWFSFESRNLEVQTILSSELKERNQLLFDELNSFIRKDRDSKIKQARVVKKELDLNFDSLVGMYNYHSLKRHNMESLPSELDELIDRCYKIASIECKKNDISFREDKEAIISDVLEKIKNENEDSFVQEDFSFCTSTESVFKAYQSDLKNVTREYDLESISSKYRFVKFQYLTSYTADFLKNDCDFFLALVDEKYPNRDLIMKNWAEFFYVCKDYFGIIDAVEQCSRDAETRRADLEVNRLSSNEKFMKDLDTLLQHNHDEYVYCFHATNTRENAMNILNNGLFMFDNDLGSTSYAELSKDDVLTYEYGSGFGDKATYVVVFRQKNGTDIVRKTTPEEKEASKGFSRRLALATQGCDYVVDPENIVGFVDRNREKVVFNEKVKKNIEFKEATMR